MFRVLPELYTPLLAPAYLVCMPASNATLARLMLDPLLENTPSPVELKLSHCHSMWGEARYVIAAIAE